MGNKHTPGVRFTGETGEWEQRKITDIGDIVTGSTPSTLNSDYYGGDYPFVSPADIQENRYVIRTNTTLTKSGFDTGRKVREGSILFVSIGSTIGKVGQASVESTTNQQINSVIPDENYDDNFVYSAIVNVSNKVKQLAATQAIPIINKSEFGKTKLMVPVDKEEQKKIGDFFANLDYLIILNQQELTTLKQTKQGFLQKMFPKEGKSVPEVRFPEFTGDWENRELGNITKKIGSGRTPKGGSSVYTQSGIPFLRSQNIYNDRVDFPKIVYITEVVDEEMANSRVQKNDVLLNITGASIGRSAVYESSKVANVNQHVCIIRLNSEIDSYFVQINISATKGQKQIETNQAGGGREGLNFQQISKMSFSYPPNKGEQTKIGNFFKQLNETIAFHQLELDALQETKKAFLKKMFV